MAFSRVCVLAAFSGLLFGAACSDDDDLVEAACAVIVDCEVVASRSECVDLLGSESTSCLECIVGEGCGFVAECDTIGPCRLPRRLNPGSGGGADGGVADAAAPSEDASSDSAKGEPSDAGPG